MNFQAEMSASGVRVIQDNYVQWRGCTGKRSYQTVDAAQAALQRTPSETALNTYECMHCYRWHVGHAAGGAQ